MQGRFIRILDVLFALVGLTIGAPLLLLVFVVSGLDTGSPLFIQARVGKRKLNFLLVKFRTMRVGTASVPTHMVGASSMTRVGRFLRGTKLDELPQLWNVLKGEMSLVGPRPCLPTQAELIFEREKRGVYEFRPGITGLAQLRGVDMSSPRVLAELDAAMIHQLTVGKYLGYVCKTAVGQGSGDPAARS